MTPATQRIVQRVDAMQRRDARLAFAVGVFKKFGDDQAGYLAALVAYYAFFSLFPLLLVAVTLLGFALGNHSALRESLLHSLAADLPIVGPEIVGHSIQGSGLGLAVGIVISLLAGLAVVRALEHAMDEVWGVPQRRRPGFVRAQLKALVVLGTLGLATLAAAVISGFGGIVGSLGSLVVNTIVVLVAFKVLTVARVTVGDVIRGAVAAGIALSLLQWLGSYYVAHVLRHASQTYGTFAIVIGLLSWLYLGAEITLYAAEINVVWVRHLWPRTLAAPPPETPPPPRPA